LFFGEKYMIEVLTKKVVDSFVFNTNRHTGWNSLTYSMFFYTILSFLFYILAIFNLLLLMY